MRLSDFRVKTDFWPLVSSNDELVIVHRDAIAVIPVLYIGCHEDTTFSIRSARNNQAVESATPWNTTSMNGGEKKKIDLFDSVDVLNIVSKITVAKGSIFVGISSFNEFDAYFKQVTVPNS